MTAAASLKETLIAFSTLSSPPEKPGLALGYRPCGVSRGRMVAALKSHLYWARDRHSRFT
jgi:hypothetical protein